MTTWVKVYNSMPSHPKFLGVGPQAGWLFVCGLCYANEHLTDGFIPTHSLPVVAPSLRSPCRVAARLVSASLWLRVENGFQIHDYHEHQRSAAEVRERREKDRQRKASGRNVRTESAQTPQGIQAESEICPQGIRANREEGREEGREEKKNNNSLRSDVLECFAYWQERCNHKTAKLGSDRQAKIEARLREGYTVHDIRRAIDGAARSPFIDEKGKRFDDIELICRSGSKLESFMERAEHDPSIARVVPITRAPHLERMDAWKRGYPEEQSG